MLNDFDWDNERGWWHNVAMQYLALWMIAGVWVGAASVVWLPALIVYFWLFSR